MKSLLYLIAIAVVLICPSVVIQADQITIEFAGTFQTDSVLYSAGDTYDGFLTYDDSVAPISHPDNSLNVQYPWAAHAVNFPGTGWELNVNSSTEGDFQVTGGVASFAYGNENSFGFDRYIVTMSALSGFVDLPNGLELNFFQIDMQDAGGTSAELLRGDALTDIPKLANAQHAGGRFFIRNPPSGCSQCRHDVTMFQVPEPSSAVVLLGLAAGILIRRKI